MGYRSTRVISYRQPIEANAMAPQCSVASCSWRLEGALPGAPALLRTGRRPASLPLLWLGHY